MTSAYWIDTRVKSPPDEQNKYFVVFKHKDELKIGLAIWEPPIGSGLGRWKAIETTDNTLFREAQVLLWQEHPKIPDAWKYHS